MSTGSPKDKPNDRLKRARGTMRKSDPYWQWWARMRRITRNYFFPENAKRALECSDPDSKTASLTITEQIYVHAQSDRVDRYGLYHQPFRHRANIEPLEQLLGPAGKEDQDED